MQDKSKTTDKKTPVAKPRAAAKVKGNADKKGRASTSALKKKQTNRAGVEICVVAARDTTSNDVNALDSKSLEIVTRFDPLLDERLHYSPHLGQDFECFMSFSDKIIGSWESTYSIIDTGVDLATVFQM